MEDGGSEEERASSRYVTYMHKYIKMKPIILHNEYMLVKNMKVHEQNSSFTFYLNLAIKLQQKYLLV